MFNVKNIFSPFRDGQANGATFFIMQSQVNLNKVKNEKINNPLDTKEEILYRLNLRESDFTDSDLHEVNIICSR